MSHLTWIARTNYRRSGISHFIYDKNPEDGSKACGIPELVQSPGGGHAFLYENKDDLSQNFEPLVGIGDNYSRDIVEDSRNPGKFKGCGLILEALLFEPDNDPSRVAEIVEKFVDFDKASAEFSALPSWLDKTDQDTRSKQKKSELKPDL